MKHHQITRRCALSVVALAWTAGAGAQDRYPSRTVKIISPAPPGALSDTLPRLLAIELSAAMQANFIVENRPGAGGAVAATAVSHAAPDGYTLLLAAGGMMSLNPYLLPKLGYDPRKDFSSIALLATTPLYLVVRGDSPYKTLDDLMSAAKAQKGQLAYGSIGAASGPSIVSALVARAKGAEFIEVPFSGYAPGLQELLAGRIAFFLTDASALPRVQGGSLRALAVTSTERAQKLPAVPTLKELGIPVDYAVWFGLYAPAGVPDAIVQTLARNARQALQKPSMAASLDSFGLEPGRLFGDDFHQYHLAEIKRWGEIVPTLNLKPGN